MDERFVSGPADQRGRFPYRWLPPKDKESIKNRVKTPISRKKVRIDDLTEIVERGPIPEFSVIDNTKNREEIPKQAGTKWNPQPCCSNEKKKLATSHVKSLTDAITYWKQNSVIPSTPIILALSNVAPTSKPSIGQMRPSTYRRVRNNKNQPTGVNSIESPISQKSVKPENTESRANKNRNYSLPPKKTGKRTKLEKKISVPIIVAHNMTSTTPLSRKLIDTFQKRADLINHATVSASRDMHFQRPIGAVDQRRYLETKTNIIHNNGNRGGGRERSLKTKVVNNNRGIEKNENRKPEVLLKIKQTLLKQIAKKKNSEEEEKKRDKRKNMVAVRSKIGKEVEKQTETMKLRMTKEVEGTLGGEVKNSLGKSVNNQRSNSKKAKRHRRSKNKTSIEAFSMQVVPESNDPFSRADKKDKAERSRRERKGNQVLINSWPDKDQSPPTRSRLEINCKMCKRCPMRQLISKIDPTVGSDRTTYPVIAFTCCRKAPKPMETSTSTSDLGRFGTPQSALPPRNE